MKETIHMLSLQHQILKAQKVQITTSTAIT